MTRSARGQPATKRHIGPWSTIDTVALASITLIAAALRLVRLSDPDALVFDETYYAKDACWYAFGSTSLCDVDGEQTQVHPPLGKWLIAAGVKILGYDSFGWRVAAAFAGTITVALLYVLARKALRSTLGATLAAGLLAFDLLHFVQSRIAMLDVFSTMFGVASVLFVVLDRDRILAQRTRARAPLISPWRVAAGVSAGAAAASKWSGVFYVVLALALTVVWEWSARRTPPMAFVRRRGPSLVAGFLIAPALLYALTYVARLDGRVLSPPWTASSWVRALWERQVFMLEFHSGLTATHPYQSPAWSWPALKRPVSYFFETAADGDYMEILATGSPLVWWSSVAALAVVLVGWARRRDPARPEGLILASFAVTYLPWLVLARGRSAVFLFYLLPALPFMFLALGYVVTRFQEHRRVAVATAGYGALVIALFAFYYPVLAKVPLPRSEWEARIWVFDDCDRPPPTASAGATVETATNGEPVDEANPPPEGWCWI